MEQQDGLILGADVQPSEFAKLAVILFFSHSLSKRRDKLKYFFRGLFPISYFTWYICSFIDETASP